jgi:hypothetical protein
MKIVILLELLMHIAWFACAALISGLLGTWVFSELWYWFVSAQYGSGPTTGAWFGIATILKLIISGKVKWPVKKDNNYALRPAIQKDLLTWCAFLLVLIVAWCMGSVLGWIR